MLSIEHDLRGRQFGWYALPDSPFEFVLTEDPFEVGRLTRVPDLVPIFFGEFAGRRLRVEHSVGVLGPSFSVTDADSGATLLRSHYTREADLLVQANEQSYHLRRSDSFAVWNDGKQDTVSFRASEAFVLMAPTLMTPRLWCCSEL